MATIIKADQVEKEYRKKILFTKHDDIVVTLFNKNKSVQKNSYKVTKEGSIFLLSGKSIVKDSEVLEDYNLHFTDENIYTDDKEILTFTVLIKKAPPLITFKKANDKGSLSYSLKNVITTQGDNNKITETTYKSECRNIEGLNINNSFMIMVIYPAANCPPIIKIYPAMDDDTFKTYKPDMEEILAFDDTSKCLYGSYDNPVDISKKEISSSTTTGVKLVNPKEYIGSITELKFSNFDQYCELKKDSNNYRTANSMINLEYTNSSEKEDYTYLSPTENKIHKYEIIKFDVLEWNDISFAGSVTFKNEKGEINSYKNIISEILLPLYYADKKDDIDLEFAASLFNFPHDRIETIEDSFSVGSGNKIKKKVIEINGKNCKIIYTTSQQDNQEQYTRVNSVSRMILVGNDKLEYDSHFSNGTRNDLFSIDKDTNYSHLELNVTSSSGAAEKAGAIIGSISFGNIFDKKAPLPINYYLYNQSGSLDINSALVSTRYKYNMESGTMNSISQSLIDTDEDTLIRGPYGLLFKIKDIPNFF